MELPDWVDYIMSWEAFEALNMMLYLLLFSFNHSNRWHGSKCENYAKDMKFFFMCLQSFSWQGTLISRTLRFEESTFNFILFFDSEAETWPSSSFQKINLL